MAEDKTKQDETKETPHAEDTLKSSGGKLFRQGILFSILFHQALILFMTNFSAPVDAFVLKREVQELANIEIYKPPQKVIQIPEVKAPPKMVMVGTMIPLRLLATWTIQRRIKQLLIPHRLGGYPSQPTQSRHAMPAGKANAPSGCTSMNPAEYVRRGSSALPGDKMPMIMRLLRLVVPTGIRERRADVPSLARYPLPSASR